MVGDAEKKRYFAKKELSLEPKIRRGIIFSDEKIFNDNDHSSRFQWCTKDDVVTRRGVSRWGPTVQCYGAIGIGFRFLVFLDRDGRLNADKFCQNCLRPLLEQLRRRGAPFRLQQDGAPCHRSARTQRYLRGVSLVESWPPRSPCLNPIENLWGIVQKAVSDRLLTTTRRRKQNVFAGREELLEAVQRAWDEVPQSVVDGLVTSYEMRLQNVVKTRGA
jgi:hypothetical protein